MSSENSGVGLDTVNEVMLVIENDIKDYYDYIPSELDDKFLELKVLLGKMNVQEKGIVKRRLTNLISKSELYTTIYLYSFLIKELKDPECLKDLLIYIIGNHKLSGKTKYYLYFQLHSARFLIKELETEDTNYLIWKLFIELCDEFKCQLNIEDSMIPEEERNQNLIIVFVSQFLITEHGPTKTVLDRCHTIIKHMNKKALIINTAECLTKEGEIPFYSPAKGNYIPEHLNKEFMSWRDIIVPYIQCERNMPNLPAITEIVQMVRQLKPGWIIDIGGNTLTANICSNLIPTIGIALCPSDLTITNEQFQATGKKLQKEDMELLQKLGKSSDHVIESVFTWNFKPQESTLTRKELGIPEDEFILAVIGARLDKEVTDDFLEILSSLSSYNITTAFIGTFDDYQQRMDKFEKLKEKTMYLGFQRDILAVLECCDLYINPLRKGGGGSGMEAMSKGLPVITLPYGDVATGAGEDFFVEDYKEMREKILQYATNKKFYSLMSKKAKERVEVVQNTDLEFEKIIKEAEKRLRKG